MGNFYKELEVYTEIIYQAKKRKELNKLKPTDNKYKDSIKKLTKK